MAQFQQEAEKQTMQVVLNRTLSNDELHEHTSWYLAVTGSFLTVVSIWTTIGNLLVFIAMCKFRSLRTLSNYLILNMAASDFLLALTVLPFSVCNDLLDHWMFGETLCKMWLAVDVLYCTASIWNIVAVAIDRFTATCFPLWYRERRSHVMAVAYISAVWTWSTLISVPPMLTNEKFNSTFVFESSRDRYQCILYNQTEYVVFSSLGSFLLPMLIVVVLYSKIFSVLHSQSRHFRNKSSAARCTQPAVAQADSPGDLQRADTGSLESVLAENSVELKDEPTNKRHSRINGGLAIVSSRILIAVVTSLKPTRRNSLKRFARREKEATKRVTVLVALFVASWTPFMVMYMYRGFSGNDVNEHLQKLVIWLGYANSAMNPCLYIWQNRELRKAYAKILHLSSIRTCH